MSGWLSKQMFFGIGYGVHVPVWATPSLFNTSCNSQESDTTAAVTPPQLSDLAVVLSRPAAYYIRTKWCMTCMQSVYVELAGNLNRGLAADSKWHHRALKLTHWPLGSSLGRTAPKQLAAVGASTLPFQSFIEPTMQQLSIYVHLLRNIVVFELWNRNRKLVVSSNTLSEMFTLSWQPKRVYSVV